MEHASTGIAIIMGICLSAACGFRIFVPLFLASIAGKYGYIPLTEGFSWLASAEATVILGTATVIEIGAYYIPWLDNLLDQIAAPAAVAAGTLLTASVLREMDPVFKWGLAIIAGGGAAGAIQSSTTFARQVSSVATAGMGNGLLATLELGSALFTVLLAIFLPVMALFMLIILLLYALVRAVRRRRPHAVAV